MTDVVWLTSILLSPKSGTLELSEKSEFPSHNYDLEVDVNVIYDLETGNYSNSDMTWTQHTFWLWAVSSQRLVLTVTFNFSHPECLWKTHKCWINTESQPALPELWVKRVLDLWYFIHFHLLPLSFYYGRCRHAGRHMPGGTETKPYRQAIPIAIPTIAPTIAKCQCNGKDKTGWAYMMNEGERRELGD